MAFKPRQSTLDPTRLQDILLQAKVQQENQPLFQTLVSIIDQLKTLRTDVDNKISKDDKIDLENQVEGLLSFRNAGVLTSLYTPVLTLVANLTGAGVDDLYYQRTGELVNVFGKIQVTPTVVGVSTQLGIKLPILSYFFFDYQCAGIAACPTLGAEVAAIKADIVNSRAQLEWIAGSASTFDFYLHFQYKVFTQ